MTRLARWLLIGALCLTLGLPTAEAQQTTRFYLGVIGDNAEAVVAGRCRVLTAGGSTDATIYTDGTLGTTKTNPLTLDTTTGECSWYGPTSTLTYDVVIVVDSGAYKGARVVVPAVSRTSAKTVKVTRASGMAVLMVPFSRSTSSVTSTATQTIPAGAVVKDVVVEVVTGVNGAKLHVSNANIGSQAYCASVDTSTSAAISFCAPTQPTNLSNATGLIHPTTDYAVTYNTMDHATAGYIWVYYLPTKDNS